MENSNDMILIKKKNENISRSQQVVLQRLKKLGIKPHENIGQHFLINDAGIKNFVQTVTPGNTVIEVGVGVGQLTEGIALRASRVIGIEIDQRFAPVLEGIVKEYPNIEMVYADVLKVKFENYIPKAKNKEDSRVQIVANIPYHISEPFLHKICNLPLESITLIVGDNLANLMLGNKQNSSGAGQISLLSQTFFNIELLRWLEKEDFFPPPRTRSAVVKLVPKKEYEFRENQRDFLLRKLFLSASKSPLIKNVLKEGIIEFKRISNIGTNYKKGFNRQHRRGVRQELKKFLKNQEYRKDAVSKEERLMVTQNEARRSIEKINIPEGILNKPFQQLDNTEIDVLSVTLRKI